MKIRLLDGLQVAAAILITGSMAVYAAPLPQATTHKPENQITFQSKPNSTPVEPVQTAPAAVVAVTWQDNPNHCTDAQWIAAGPPFGCIDKPVQEAVAVAPAAPLAAVSGCGDNSYANYIYMHESGCRTDAVNPIGACGIGQALPCSKMGCSLSDYACQNAWFTNYANATYGGWQGAYNHWLAYSWW